MDYIATASDMREKAWAELMSSPAFRAFRAADNMVVDLGGSSVMPNLALANGAEKPAKIIEPQVAVRPRTRAKDGSVKPSQAESALLVLKELGPMGVKDIMELAVAQGATAGGSNPLANFRSALSHDDRFYSFRHEGGYLWWLTDVPFPEGWDEAADDLLRDAASSNSSQEGGDGHAANNTVLAS